MLSISMVIAMMKIRIEAKENNMENYIYLITYDHASKYIVCLPEHEVLTYNLES